MAAHWNFERRQSTCARLLVGVSVVAAGKAGFETTLETVRSRMKMPREDALFAARRLADDKLIGFDEEGDVVALAAGLERAAKTIEDARSKARDVEDAKRILRAGGLPLELLRTAILASGGAIACASPASEPEAQYRLALDGDAISLERAGDNGVFERVPSDA